MDARSGGGNAERTFQLSQALARRGINAKVLTTDAFLTDARRAQFAPVELRVLPCLNQRYFFPRISARELRSIVKDADVIHLIGHWYILNSLIAHEAYRQGRPYVVSPCGAHKVYGRSRYLKRAFNALSGSRVIRRASAHIAVTDAELPDFERYGIARATVNVIPNGIDEKQYSDTTTSTFRHRHHLGNAPYVLYIGRLNFYKGPDLLLDAFCSLSQSHPELHLVFAGPDENMQHTLESRARNRGVFDRVHFTGFLGATEKSQALHGCKFMVIPSRHEAMSIVVLEAGIAGRPVLISKESGFPVVESIGAGLLCEPTAEDVARGLSSLLMRPDDELDAMGRSFAHYVRATYSWDNVVKDFVQIFARLAGRASVVDER